VLYLSLMMAGWCAFWWLSGRSTTTDIGGMTYAGHIAILTDRIFELMVLASYLSVWAAAIWLSGTPKHTLMYGITTTLVVAATLISLELPAAFGLVNWQLILESLTGRANPLVWAYRTDPELGFRRRPYDHWSGTPPSDIEGRLNMPATLDRPITFTYDRWGYRNPTDRQTAEIALIGDSYVEGWYVSDEQTVARRLEARVERPVVNLGVAGYGTLQELIVLKRDALRFRPNVVVWFFFEGNDLYDDHTFENAMRAVPGEADEERFTRGDRWRHRSFTLNLLKGLRRLSSPIFPIRPPYVGFLDNAQGPPQTLYFARYAAVPWDDWIESRWITARGSLQQAVEVTRARNIKLIICFVPIKFRVYRPFIELPAASPAQSWGVWPIRKRFAEFCHSERVSCLDLTPLFQKAVRRGGMPYAPVDTHWSVEGHDLVAERLADEIRKHHWWGMRPKGIGMKSASACLKRKAAHGLHRG
jgi:GDSL-like Lipase/Acylhydrolase family